MKNNIWSSFSAMALLALGLSLGTSSCVQNEEAIFDKSVNERIEEQVQTLRSLLIDSKEGWILDYVPSAGKQYGAYYIGLKFSDKDEVLATTEELKGDQLWYKSSYVVGKDRNVSINFDTGNMAIHRYTTPDSTYAGGISLGYEGDHEFNLVKIVSKDEIQVRGKRSRNLMTLRRATSSIDSFIQSIRTMKATIFNPKDMGEAHQDAIEGTLGGKKQLFKVNGSGLNVYTYTTEGESKVQTISYFVTPTGIRFVEPIEGVSEMTWQGGKLTAAGGTLTARRDPYYDKFAAYLGNYTLEVGATDKRVKYEVTFAESGYNEYLISGTNLPFSIKAKFNPDKNRFEIFNQQVGTAANGNKIMLCMWDSGAGYLVWSLGEIGMYSSLVKGSAPAKYQMNDNGVWGQYKSISLLLWQLDGTGKSQGRYDGYAGFNPFITLPTFTRKAN